MSPVQPADSTHDGNLISMFDGSLAPQIWQPGTPVARADDCKRTGVVEIPLMTRVQPDAEYVSSLLLSAGQCRYTVLNIAGTHDLATCSC